MLADSSPLAEWSLFNFDTVLSSSHLSEITCFHIVLSASRLLENTWGIYQLEHCGGVCGRRGGGACLRVDAQPRIHSAQVRAAAVGDEEQVRPLRRDTDHLSTGDNNRASSISMSEGEESGRYSVRVQVRVGMRARIRVQVRTRAGLGPGLGLAWYAHDALEGACFPSRTQHSGPVIIRWQQLSDAHAASSAACSPAQHVWSNRMLFRVTAAHCTANACTTPGYMRACYHDEIIGQARHDPASIVGMAFKNGTSGDRLRCGCGWLPASRRTHL